MAENETVLNKTRKVCLTKLKATAICCFGLVAMNGLATIRYVDLNCTNATPPFTSWTTAATNIQDAVDAAVAGDEVVVTNGVYASGGRAVYGTMTNRVAIDRALLVRSLNGPLVTIIAGQRSPGAWDGNGDGAIRCVYMGTNAVLSGFTLTNGHTRTAGDQNKEQCGGGVWCEASGVITNCILTRNCALYTGGGAHFGTLNNCTLTGNLAYVGGGAFYSMLNHSILSSNSASWVGGGAYCSALNNCTLTGNSASDDGGGALLSTLNNCTLTGNSAHVGGGAYEGTLNNCTLSGNWASYEGGGASHGTLNNCILTGNSAGFGGGAHSGLLNDCILIGNSAQDGGGAHFGTLNNCTLTSNSAKYSGGAHWGTMHNCIVYYNTASSNAGMTRTDFL